MSDIIVRIVAVIPTNRYQDDKIHLVLGTSNKTLLILTRTIVEINYNIYETRCNLLNSNGIEFDFPDIYYAFGSLNHDDRNYNHVNEWHQDYCFPEDGEEIYSVTMLRCGSINVFTRAIGG